MAATQMSDVEARAAANKAVMQRFIELFIKGDWEEDLPEVIAPDCVLHEPGGVDLAGLEAMILFWKSHYPKLKNLEWDVLGQISEGDLLAIDLIMRATFEGEFNGRQIDGKPVEYQQFELMRISDGKIAEWWVQFDRQRFAEQLGMKVTW